ncbi:ABC transporter permease [Mesorhizobium sp. M0222]|uniref:ABC transporter permease n=1 Tax=Mesorhizobium sp. M0222 TaxID=2956921 RepID=UPI003335AD12
MFVTGKYFGVVPNRFTLTVSRYFGQITGLLTTLALLTVVTFILGNVVPIDPALTLVGDRASSEAYDLAREQLGLNLPLYQRYFHYLGNLVTGDLGTSLVTGNPVLTDLLQVFPGTIELSMIAMTIGTVAGVLSGVWAAQYRDRWQDKMLRVVSVLGYSTPVFWLGLVALLVFYYQLGWAEGPGRIDIGFDSAPAFTGFVLIDSLLLGDLQMFGNAISHIALPAAVLGFATMAYIARMTRGFMVVQLDQEYAVTARAKGLSARTILWRHAFRNIRAQLITVLALSLGGLLEGAILTETVFSWPGLGLYMKLSLFNGDLNAVLGTTLLVGIIYVGLSFLADALTAAIDPTVRAGKK